MKVVISWGARLVSLIGGVLLIREMVKLIGVDGYAALCVLISAFSWLLMLDLGIGYSLQNYLSEQRNDPIAVRNLRLTAGILLALIGVFAVSVLCLFYEHITELMFGANYKSTVSKEDLESSVLVGGLLSIVTGTGTAASKIWFAEHRGHVLIICTAIATAAGLAVAHLLNLTQTKLTVPLGTVLFFLPLTCVMAYALLIKTRLLNGIPSWSFDCARKIVSRGRVFWLFALASGLTLQVDNLVLTHYVSPDNVVTYNIVIRIAYAGLTFYSLALGLLHPLMTEHLSENRPEEVSRRVTQIICLGALFCLTAGSTFFLFSKQIIDFIAPEVSDMNNRLKILMIFYLLIRVWADAHSVVLMSASKVARLIPGTLIQGFLCIGIMLLAVPRWGIDGIVIAYIGSYLATNAWYAPFLCHRDLGVRFSQHYIFSISRR